MSLSAAYEGLPWTATTTIQCSVFGKLLSVKLATDSIFAAASPMLHFVAPTMRFSGKAQPRKFPSSPTLSPKTCHRKRWGELGLPHSRPPGKHERLSE
jgi:hypothetical protein